VRIVKVDVLSCGPIPLRMSNVDVEADGTDQLRPRWNIPMRLRGTRVCELVTKREEQAIHRRERVLGQTSHVLSKISRVSELR